MEGVHFGEQRQRGGEDSIRKDTGKYVLLM